MNRLFISFSGGRTSAFMTFKLLEKYRGNSEIVVIFANTGKEDNRTLDFVKSCDDEFGFKTVWVEAVVHSGRKACTHKVVNFETASRGGEPFSAVIGKYGIPNPAFPHCTRETKLNPIKSYLRSIGWRKGTYKTAVGIRSDEMDRMSEASMKDGYIYPLVNMGVRKCDVLAWWKQQPFDLEIPEHYGNCVTCWKKTDRKLFTIAQDDESAFGWNAKMERDYALAGTNKKGEPRVFFRKNRSTEQILEAALKFPRSERFVEGMYSTNELDLGSSCGESCEIGADE